MTYDDLSGALRPAPSIDAVLAAHGARKVLAAAVAALLRGKYRKTRPPDAVLARSLNAHMMRDIGMAPPPGLPFHWPL